METQRNLLIVDDEPEILHFLGKMFEENGYGVEIAENGAHALAILERMNINVMVSDIRMPGMNGIELMKKARQYDSDLQCIFMSGHPDVEVAVIAMKEGAHDVIIKPVDFDCLERSVSEAIRGKELQREIETKKRELAPYHEQHGERATIRTRASYRTTRGFSFSCWI